MPKDKSKAKSNTTLREQAEKRLSERPKEKWPPDDILKLVHELEVHQIELEMQNEELRRAELVTERAQEKYVDFYDFAPVGYLTLDEKGLISDLNLAASELLGVERKVLVHKPFHGFIKTESQDAFYFHRQEVLASSTKQTCELVIKKNDGTFFDAQLYSIGVDIEGQLSIRIVLTDIAERRQAKESLAEAYGELEETQQELIRIEKLALLGKFSSGIAHEIRNPLANIRASAQFCLAQYKLNKEIKKHLGIMLRNSEHANKIIKDLIDLAKPSEVSLKAGKTNDMIKRVCDLVRTRCEKQHVLVHTKVSRRLPPILMDEERMEKAFLNFVLNALDAMPKGGKLSMNVYPHFDRDKIVITIQDTGKGIPQEDLDNIFHPFFTTKRTGIGLGLCLADQVISSHKGRLSVTSKVGEGTMITIELPIARES